MCLILLVFYSIGELKAQNHGQVVEYLEQYNADVHRNSLESAVFSIKEKELIQSLFKWDTLVFEYLELLKIDSLNIDIISYSGGDYCILIKNQLFNSQSHKIENQGDKVLFIDSKVKYGARFNLPIREFDTFSVRYNGNQVSFPKAEWAHFYNFNIGMRRDSTGDFYYHTKVVMDKRNHRVYVVINGGDGGVGYSVIWVFDREKYIGKLVDVP